MKTNQFIFRVFLIILTAFGLQSCLKNDNNDYQYFQLGTMNLSVDSKSVLLDSDYTLTAKNTESIPWDKYKDQDRVMVLFNDIDQNQESKEIHATIQSFQKIDTKEISLDKSFDELQEYIKSNNKLNISQVYIKNGFLTIQTSYLEVNSEESKSQIDLFAALNESDELELFLVHTSDSEANGSLTHDITCFPIDNIKELLKEQDGVKIRYHSLLEGLQDHLIEYKNL